MRRFLPLFLVLAAVVAIGTIATRRRRIAKRWQPSEPAIDNPEPMGATVVYAGIADVDPSQMMEMGEGIDLDANERLQAQRREDRDLLVPRPGENLPP